MTRRLSSIDLYGGNEGFYEIEMGLCDIEVGVYEIDRHVYEIGLGL